MPNWIMRLRAAHCKNNKGSLIIKKASSLKERLPKTFWAMTNGSNIYSVCSMSLTPLQSPHLQLQTR